MYEVELEFYAHEKDVTTIVYKIQKTTPVSCWKTISIGNCGWANAPDCWWIRADVTLEERAAIVDWLKDESGIELYNEALIY